jgi:hypothetical protein
MTTAIRYLIYRAHLDTELSDEEVSGYAHRLEQLIRRAYPDAAVGVEVRERVSGTGGGYQGDDEEIREHLAALADRAWNEGVGECSGPECSRSIYAKRLCLAHYHQARRAGERGEEPTLKPIRGDAPALVALSLRVTAEVKAAAHRDPDGARRALEVWAGAPTRP